MVKNNRKGFMMAELIVVSAIVLTVLSVLYISYSKIYTVYSARISYYDTVTLYKLGYYRDILIENKKLTPSLANAKNNGITTIYDTDDASSSIFTLTASEQTGTNNAKYKDKVFLIYTHRNNVSANALNGKSVNKTFKDYVKYLSTSVTINSSEYLMIMERCMVGDKDKCKYAYLEIFDGTEPEHETVNPGSGSIPIGTPCESITADILNYTGSYEIDGNSINFLTSGTLTLKCDLTADVFLVGGGGGGGSNGGSGGHGGATTTQTGMTIAGGNYTITIGDGGNAASNGGATSAFNLSAAGGEAGTSSNSTTSSETSKGGRYLTTTGNAAYAGGNGVLAFNSGTNRYAAGGGGGMRVNADGNSYSWGKGEEYNCYGQCFRNWSNITYGAGGTNGGGTGGVTRFWGNDSSQHYDIEHANGTDATFYGGGGGGAGLACTASSTTTCKCGGGRTAGDSGSACPNAVNTYGIGGKGYKGIVIVRALS